MAPAAVAPLLPHEMEHIRNVFDEDAAGKKFSSIATPRDDARMLRSTEKHTIPCECIVELYELLWRWGHRTADRRGFAENFGFVVPNTVVIVNGRPYAWYFVSKKDGALLRKSEASLALCHIERTFCRERGDGETPIAATWLPMASQFPEARCHLPYAEFLSVSACRTFLSNMRSSHSGILQAFVQPHGVSNFLIRTVQFRGQTSLCVRTNRSLINQGKGTLFDLAATFEGWPGLSSSSSRYRSHKHPHMEALVYAVGETLNGRIEQERVRQMLFLAPTQHVALHFKVAKDHTLHFIYASVVSEKEVILQTRPQLLMGDQCMTESLPLASLLPGGTDLKVVPYKGKDEGDATGKKASADQSEAASSALETPRSARAQGGGARGRSLPPVKRQGRRTDADADVDDGPTPQHRGRNLSARPPPRPSSAPFIPRMSYARPIVPEPPFKICSAAREDDDALVLKLGESGCSAGRGTDTIKRPLIVPTQAPPRQRPQLENPRSGTDAHADISTSRAVSEWPAGWP